MLRTQWHKGREGYFFVPQTNHHTGRLTSNYTLYFLFFISTKITKTQFLLLLLLCSLYGWVHQRRTFHWWRLPDKIIMCYTTWQALKPIGPETLTSRTNSTLVQTRPAGIGSPLVRINKRGGAMFPTADCTAGTRKVTARRRWSRTLPHQRLLIDKVDASDAATSTGQEVTPDAPMLCKSSFILVGKHNAVYVRGKASWKMR